MAETIAAGAWENIQYTLEAKAKLDRAGHTATVVGNRILFLAGRRSSSFYNDMLWFDVVTRKWSAPLKVPFKSRANHTALLMGRKVWVIGGGNSEEVLGDVHVLDLDTSKWHAPDISDGESLLVRTAHACEVHPSNPQSILIFGGYGGKEGDYDFLNDVVLLHTGSGKVERVSISGPTPRPRGYHSMTAVGQRVYVFGGRTNDGVVGDESMLSILDARRKAWVPSTRCKGRVPSARSSHRAVAYNNGVIIFGGAGGEDSTQRLNDLYVLIPGAAGGGGPTVNGVPVCEWKAAEAKGVAGRSAHNLSVVGTKLYVMCGYAGRSCKDTKYYKDCWALDLEWLEGLHTAGPQQQQQQQHSGGTNHQQKQGLAGTAAPAGAKRPTAEGEDHIARAGSGGTAAAAAGGVSEWRSTKRQRSGSMPAAEPQVQVQNQQQQQQQPPSEVLLQTNLGDGAMAGVPGCALPLAAAGTAATAAAAAAALGGRANVWLPCGGMVAEGYMPMASPARCGAYDCQHERELHHVRAVLAETDRSRSNTEGQLAQCQQQLAEKEREKEGFRRRLDEQQQQLVAAQMEANTCRLTLEREEAHRKSAESAQEQAMKDKREAEACLRQGNTVVQGLRAEVRKKEQALAEREREKSRLEQELRGEREQRRKACDAQDSLRGELDGVRAKKNELEGEVLRLTTQLSASKDEMERKERDLQAAIRKQQQEQQQQVERANELQKQLSERQAEAAAATRQADQQQANIQKLLAEQEAVKAKHSALEASALQREQDLQRQLDKVQQQVSDLRSKLIKSTDGWAQEGPLISQLKGLVQQLAANHEAHAM